MRWQTLEGNRPKLRRPLLAAIMLAVAGGMFFDAQIVMNTAAAHTGAYEIGFGFYSHELIRSAWRLLSPLAAFGAFAAWAWQQRRFGLYWLYF